MVKIEFEFDDNELKVLIREEWYRKIRYQVVKELRDLAEVKIKEFIDTEKEDFPAMIKEALKDVLKEFTIKDLKGIERMLGEREKLK